MSDRFYDKKGIEHLTKENADWANQRYLSEEQEAREQGLRLQRQQLEAAERVARQAEGQRREQAEAERARLDELKRQGTMAQRDREYQRQVLFLKESDEPTRLETFLEMLLNQVSLKDGNEDTFYAMLLSQLALRDYTKGGPVEEDDAFGRTMTEHHKAMSLFFKLPSVPEECRENGTLTKNIKAVVASVPELKPPLLPPRALQLQADGQRIHAEIQQTETNTKRAARATRWLGLFAAASFLFGIVIFVQTKMDAPNQNSNDFTVAAYFMLGLGAVLTIATAISHLILSPQASTFQRQKEGLAHRKDSLESELEPLLKQRSEAERLAKLKAQQEYDDAIGDSVRQWMSAFQNAFLKSFFDQGLWIEAEFPNRLKAALKEIQKPFPSSCRTDVEKLQGEQVERAYLTLTETVAEEIVVRQMVRCTDYIIPLIRPSHATRGGESDEDESETDRKLSRGIEIPEEFEAHRKEWEDRKTEIMAILRSGPADSSST